MKTFKTPKGTEIPLLNLRGKDYLQVAHRLVWFREDHSDWGIETEIVSHDETKSLVRASIKDAGGKIIAQATKQEDQQGFGDHLEKAETGAIGRALALCGYGTQFAPEFDESERIVDSPLAMPPKKLGVVPPEVSALSGAGGYIMTFGKYTGKRLDEIGAHDLDSYLRFLQTADRKTPSGDKAIAAIDAYLSTKEFPRAK